MSKVYPNPADNVVFIESEQVIIGYDVYDYTGRLILSADGTSTNKAIVDAGNFTNGIYVITLEFASGVTKAHRVIIQDVR